MRRRDFIAGGILTAASQACFAQQLEGIRRIGVLMNFLEDDPEAVVRIAAFRKGLRQLGWIEGRNLKISYRWAGGRADMYTKFAQELSADPPDVFLASATPSVAALRSVSRQIPVVFVQVVDPVAAGYVTSLSRPGGNATGFINFELGISGKWLGLLREIAPATSRVLVLRDPSTTAGLGQFGALQSLAQSRGVELEPVGVEDLVNLEEAVLRLKRSGAGGVIVLPSPAATVARSAIIQILNSNKVPAIFPFRYYAVSGGVVSYGPDQVQQFLAAATYVDRILKGEKAADLPVQAPNNYQLTINMKAANDIGMVIPSSLLSRADEVIE